jgi:hypothetical protein
VLVAQAATLPRLKVQAEAIQAALVLLLLVAAAVVQAMAELKQVSLVVLVVVAVGSWVQVAQETLQALLHRKETMEELQQTFHLMVVQVEAVLLLQEPTVKVLLVVQVRPRASQAVL